MEGTAALSKAAKDEKAWRGFKPGQFEKRLSELLLRGSGQSEDNEEDTLPEPGTTP